MTVRNARGRRHAPGGTRAILPSGPALSLGISPHSVRVHLSLARRRLKAHNTAEAVAIALTRGLLT